MGCWQVCPAFTGIYSILSQSYIIGKNNKRGDITFGPICVRACVLGLKSTHSNTSKRVCRYLAIDYV